ncbi:MAG: hypothetical protein WCR01_04160 [Bacteroidota bacterium]
MLNRRYISLVFIAMLLWCCARTKNQEASRDPWPLQEGTTWIYQGQCNNQLVKVEMEIKKVTRQGSLLFAEIQGYPSDPMDGSGWKTSTWGLLVVGNERYYRLEGKRLDSVRTRLADPGDNLAGLVEEQELMLQLPLQLGNSFGETFQLTRSDSNYYWQVTGKSIFDPSSIGIREMNKPIDQFTLRFSTLPDETLIDFVPGLGIGRYRYSHHGTPAETDMKLSEIKGLSVAP